MHVRCTYCRHSFNITREYMVQAVDKANEKGQKYHSLECINCRKQIKVPVAQMKRNLPEPAGEEPEAEQGAGE